MQIAKLTYVPISDTPDDTKFLNESGDFSTPASGGTPGGSTTQVQVNIGGVFSGYSTFTFDPNTNTLSISGNAVLTSADVAGLYSGDKTFSGGTVQFQSGLDVNGPVVLQSRIFPTTLASGNTNNYNPSGLAIVSRLMVDPDPTSGSTLTGLANPGEAQAIFIMNIGTTAGAVLTLAHQSGSSSAGNKFTCPNLANLDIRPGGGVFVIYDDTGYATWRVVSP